MIKVGDSGRRHREITCKPIWRLRLTVVLTTRSMSSGEAMLITARVVLCTTETPQGDQGRNFDYGKRDSY